MANIKIAQLTNQTAISDTDLIIVETATSTNKMTVGKFKELILASHLTENASERIEVSRDLSLTGTQTIALTKGKKPKAVICMANVTGTKKNSFGFADQTGIARNNYSDNTTGLMYFGGGIAVFADSFSNRTIGGSLNNITENSFDINWAHTGSGATGIGSLIFLVLYHGE